jgi:hypothetical protein
MQFVQKVTKHVSLNILFSFLYTNNSCPVANFQNVWVGAENFSLHHHVQNGSGAQPASYPMGTRGSYLGGKVARA